jgi:hypothetical protein
VELFGSGFRRLSPAHLQISLELGNQPQSTGHTSLTPEDPTPRVQTCAMPRLIDGWVTFTRLPAPEGDMLSVTLDSQDGGQGP